MVPQNEPLPKRLVRIYFENGLSDALSEAEQHTKGRNINYLFRGLCFGLTKFKQLNKLIWPYTDSQDLKNLIEYSQTRFGERFLSFYLLDFSHWSIQLDFRDWQNSLIRCIRWHPNVFKLAVASVEDNIRIYSGDALNTPILKNGYQKCISSLAWRPLSAGELAVGCNTGIIVWKLEHPGRQTSQFIHLTR